MKPRKYAVIGLGQFGVGIVNELSRYGADVIAIDRVLERVDKVKDLVSLAVSLDARDLRALDEHDLGHVDVVVATIGRDFESQILAVVHAKKLGVAHVVARATTSDHRQVLLAVGADVVVNPEEEAAIHAAHRLLVPDVEEYFELADGFSLVEVQAPAGVVGRSLKELDLRNRFRLSLLAIKRRSGKGDEGLDEAREFLIPRVKEVLEQDDRITLLGSDLDIASFLSSHGAE